MFGKLKQSVYKVNTYGEQDKSGETVKIGQTSSSWLNVSTPLNMVLSIAMYNVVYLKHSVQSTL